MEIFDLPNDLGNIKLPISIDYKRPEVISVASGQTTIVKQRVPYKKYIITFICKNQDVATRTANWLYEKNGEWLRIPDIPNNGGIVKLLFIKSYQQDALVANITATVEGV